MAVSRFLRGGLLTAALAVATCGAASADTFKLDGEMKPAFVYFNVKNDGGWVQALDEARVKTQDNLGIEIPYTEKVEEVATQIRPAVERYIDRGYNVILGSAFGYSDTFKELAEKHPDVLFLNPAGITNGPNLMSYYGRTYESQYLCGMVAGAMSKSGKLGFVAANPLPLVTWTVNAYALGAQRMNPDATVNVVFTGAWYDPVKEREAALALIEQGVDVIGIHVDTPAVPVVAQEKGIMATGHHRDMTEFAADSVECSSVWVWDKFLTPALQAASTDGLEMQPYGAFLSIKDGGTDIALADDLPADVKEKVMAARQEIIDGKHVFEGPVVDQDGNEVVAAGEHPDDGQMWQMDYLVKGVVGSLN
ncbi:BMP family ABC transporter substrate-binding protein [Microbaculum marinum]|uniref:BMP family ABC transporter substrate-binding protein n=1 Tax=Microbaculum marinum TaxID=1764581 RepID=A0AAW9S4W4_9HYPH